jgi:hypothetical protein
MNKEHEVNRQKLSEIISKGKESCVLRVCYRKCQDDIAEEKL